MINLTEMEELVLMAILKLAGKGYGATIREELEAVIEKTISIGLLYAIFDRLERKGLVKSWQGEPTAERGGRAKRYFEIEPSGKEALREAQRIRQRLLPSWAADVLG
jgi:PadR family transcriptional regulator, regulatory protein PadR